CRYGVVNAPDGGFRVAKLSEVEESDVVVHDIHRDDPSYAFALSRLGGEDLNPTVTGIFRAAKRPTYDDLLRDQVDQAKKDKPADLQKLLTGNDTWTI